MKKPVVVYGPQGCGKTQSQSKLLAYFELESVVDDWNGKSPLAEGVLALTSIEPPYAHNIEWVAYSAVRGLAND